MSAALLSQLALPDAVAERLWHGGEWGRQVDHVVASGHRLLDRELPGGGWPCGSLTELLQPAGLHAEWRLLAPALVRVQKRGRTVFVLGSPYVPHLPGLRQMGLDDRRFVWVRPAHARDVLWAAQQILRSGEAGALLAWLPSTDARVLRRLQACALDGEAPAFVMRALQCREETSPAPLRLQVLGGTNPGYLRLQVFKRRGPSMAHEVELPALPHGLASVFSTGLARTAAPMPRVQKPPRLASGMLITSIGRAMPASPANGELFQETSDEPLAGALLPAVRHQAC